MEQSKWDLSGNHGEAGYTSGPKRKKKKLFWAKIHRKFLKRKNIC